MSDVEASISTTSTWTTTTMSTLSPTTTSAGMPASPTPVSSSSTITSEISTTPLLPSISTSLPLLSSLLSPTSSSRSSTSTSSTMSSSTTSVPTTSTMSTLIPTTTASTITTSITITPISTITTTATLSLPSTTLTSSTPSSSTTTVTTTVTSVDPSTSTSSPPPTATPPIIYTSRTDSSVQTPEAMISSQTSIGTMSTFSSTVYISTTDDRGSPTAYAPPFITSTVTFMGPGNTPTTSTTVIANPTLNPDTRSPSSFFQNRGAVAGVFTLVALAVISITIWIIFFARRRRREMSLERDNAVSAAGFHRTPLDDGESESSHRYDSAEFLAIPMANPDSGRHRRSTSRLLENNNGRVAIMPDAYHEDRGRDDPFIEFTSRNSRDGYRDMPSPTSPHLNIPPSAFAPYRDRNSTDGMAEVGTALAMGTGIIRPTHHAHHSSGSSLEPLLARRNGPSIAGPPLLATHNLSNGRGSRTPSTEPGSSASTSKPLYLPSLNHPNFYGTNNTSAHSAIFDNREEHQDLGNGSVGANEAVKRLDGDVHGDSEVSTAENGFELEKPVLVVRNLPDAASTLSLS